MRYLLVLAVTLALVPSAGARQHAGPTPFHPSSGAPANLHAFVYRADEPVKADHTYSQMPAFAWSAVKGALHYELQLATSRTFSDSTTLYNQTYDAPAASIQLQLPWMTGNPYALWVHVRAVARGHTTAWSTAFGFNTAWQQIPTQERAPTGLIRWSPVDGATYYDVWYMDGPENYDIHFSTLTNVADEREFWTFHPAFAGTIKWRVRAVRVVDPKAGSLANGISVESHGPYSPVFTTTNSTALSAASIQGVSASSNVDSTTARPRPLQLTPGFAWTGADTLGRTSNMQLSRVYIFSDKQCVNRVMTGSVTGSPAWAPRTADPLALPATAQDVSDTINGKHLAFGAQSGTFTADGFTPVPAESVTAASVSLPDNGWPQGRYWWTVVPVAAYDIPDPVNGFTVADKIEYHDMALPQDVCAAGQVWPFGVQSAPVTTTSSNPYASGLVDGTRVVSATTLRPTFQNLPLITWEPALAAQTYEIELSRHAYPWVAVRQQTSVVTSAVLPLTRSDTGVWYYRVRGVNPNLPGLAQKLAWSKLVAIRISGDRFVIVK